MSSTLPLSEAAPLLEERSPGLGSELKRYLAQHKKKVEAMIRTGGPDAGLAAGSFYSRVYDGLLGSLFQMVVAVQNERTSVPVSLAAVGSYGRGALSFGSDLDVRILCEKKPESAKPLMGAMLYALWDAGLSVGHQVVTPGQMIELARNDLPTATSLLDWRVIVGDQQISERLLARVHEGLFGAGTIHKFLERLEERAEARYQRFGGSVYLLEPDVKNGPGGLRDLDIAHWAARARWRVAGLSELVRAGVLVQREWKQIEQAQELLWRVRNLLHLYAGRRSDRLSFDRQETLARDLGYGTGGAGVEHFMSDYYRQARVISRAREMIVARAKPSPKKKPRERLIGRGLKLTNEELSIVDPAELEADPALALRLYDEAVRRDVRVYPFARDAVARAASAPEFCRRLRESPEAAKLFVRLVTVVQRTRFAEGSVLGALHDVGIVVAMIPEFAPVIGRVHHDVYHVYTVDVHSVAAVDRLRALCRGELATEHPLASRLAAEIARPNVLFFAALLHDIGKDIGGKNHSERGAELTEAILKRLNLPEPHIAEVQHLVAKHLRMYHVATRRDIDDPRTLEAFCQEVHGREGLRELYLLTIADVSTTSPTALTNWKARMLEDLYVAADRLLSHGGGPRDGARMEEAFDRVRELCPDRGERDFLEHFLKVMPERYLFANEPDKVVRHSRFARQAQMRHVNVCAMSIDEPYVELGFIADDRQGLLAVVTAALAAARLKVVGAQIYSWKDVHGRVRALDLFWVRSGTDAKAALSTLSRIERDMERLMSQELSPAELVSGSARTSRWSDRPSPPVDTEVNIDNRAATDHTVIEVITRDRPALLFWLSNTLQHAGLSILLAKINTEGTQVADVFYVTDADGNKVSDPARIETLRAEILETIRRIEGTAYS